MIAMAHQRVFYTGDVSLFQEVVGFSAEVVVSFFFPAHAFTHDFSQTFNWVEIRTE
jgi:hypothetical protein